MFVRKKTSKKNRKGHFFFIERIFFINTNNLLILRLVFAFSIFTFSVIKITWLARRQIYESKKKNGYEKKAKILIKSSCHSFGEYFSDHFISTDFDAHLNSTPPDHFNSATPNDHFISTNPVLVGRGVC